VGVLKHWIENCVWYMTPDEQFDWFEALVKDVLAPSLPTPGAQLLQALKKRKEQLRVQKAELEAVLAIETPAVGAVAGLEQLEAVQIAEQLTYLDSAIFRLISPSECLSKVRCTSCIELYNQASTRSDQEFWRRVYLLACAELERC